MKPHPLLATLAVLVSALVVVAVLLLLGPPMKTVTPSTANELRCGGITGQTCPVGYECQSDPQSPTDDGTGACVRLPTSNPATRF